MATGARIRAKNGGEEIERLSRVSGKAKVRVGILKGTGEHPKAKDGQTVSEIAFWNEFGTTGKHPIPPRPVLTRTLREHRFYSAEFQSALRAYLAGNTEAIRAMHVIGLKATSDVKATLTALKDPPNALATRREKAKKVHSGKVT